MLKIQTNAARVRPQEYPAGIVLSEAIDECLPARRVHTPVKQYVPNSLLVIEAAAVVDRDLKVSAAARAWLDAAVERGAADLDYSAVVATIVGEEPKS